uniref:Uncharacterized protein n=1 Tax=Opuntia streptacantha TaxID=393608 RepID=A0A7C9CRH0_OPUST
MSYARAFILNSFKVFTNPCNSLEELPFSFTASSASLRNFRILFRLSTSPRLTDSAKARARSFELGIELAPSQTLTPTLSCSTSNVAFENWSAPIGQASNSTPATSPSNTEFHPQ